MFYAVIMAGGSGTRLWPLSRQATPKQALKLVGERTMFQHAVDRLAPLFPPERIFIVTRDAHAEILKSQAPEIPPANFLCEPEGRGTAAAIGLAAITLRQLDPYGVMAVLTADHYITDTGAFRSALSAASVLAGEGYLVTLGIKPNAPSTAYGYIEQDGSLPLIDGLPAYRVERFVEKPDVETAMKMLETGKFSWNSGMFIWHVNTILAEFERQMPEFAAQLEGLSTFLGSAAFSEAIAHTWPQVKKQTIDYGIMEGAQDVAVLPVEIGWSDIGSWTSLFELLPNDEHGNVLVGPHLAIDTQRSLVFGEKRLIATIGVEDLLIVDTEDALLVCSREREQDVREVVRQLTEGQQTEWL